MKKLNDIPKEELELMGYDDIAYLILEETKKKMKINDLFREICNVLNLSEETFENHIADFFEMLTIDQKFIMLDDGYWDLRIRHSEKIVIEDEEDFEEIEVTEEELEENIEDDNYYDEEEVNDDVDEDDLKDLVVIDEEDESM